MVEVIIQILGILLFSYLAFSIFKANRDLKVAITNGQPSAPHWFRYIYPIFVAVFTLGALVNTFRLIMELVG